MAVMAVNRTSDRRPYRASNPTPVPAPPAEPPGPVTPDSPQPDPEPLPTYEDPPPVTPVA